MHRVQPPESHGAGHQRVAGEAEQVTQGEQPVGERPGRAVAVDIEQQADGGEVEGDRGCVAAGAHGTDGGGDERVASETGVEAQDHQTVGERVERAVAVDVEGGDREEALGEDAVARTVLAAGCSRRRRSRQLAMPPTEGNFW